MAMGNRSGTGFDMSGSFDNESDACLMSLKELFLSRVNHNK